MEADRFTKNGIPAQENCPLAPLSSFRIGGTARLALFPQTKAQLLTCLDLARRENIPFEIVGNGSNLLFPDGVYTGLMIFTRNLRAAELTGDTVTAEAGVPLPALAVEALRAGLSGLEFAQGIPGTVGGGVFMNAGAFGGCMADVTAWSEWYDCESGETGRFEGDSQRFGIRTSIYEREKRYILLGAGLKLRADDPNAIRARMEDFRDRRRRTQPIELPSAGSIFRHPPGAYAGRLIEDCGLKGTRIGGAEVSAKHAGFIVNMGGATAGDVADLIALIRERVERQTGYRLECEIRTVGFR